MRVFPEGDFTIVTKQNSDNHDQKPSGLANDDEKHRMIFRYNTNTHAHKSELKRGDVSGHGTFHCGLEGQHIKAAGEGRLAKVGLGVSTDKRDTTTMQFSMAFVQNQGQNQ